MTVAQGCLPHVCDLNVALGAGVHEDVALRGMELGGGNDLGQFFHVGGFNVNNVCKGISAYRVFTNKSCALND